MSIFFIFYCERCKKIAIFMPSKTIDDSGILSRQKTLLWDSLFVYV